MAVTADKVELPVAVGDSARDLAKLLGMHEVTIYSLASRGTPSKKRGIKIVKVAVKFNKSELEELAE